jgi:hypothetical protein
VGHASRSDGLLRLETSRARVSQTDLKTGRCATMGGARGIIVEVVSVKAEDRQIDTTDCVGPFYPKITVSNLLCPRGIVVI